MIRAAEHLVANVGLASAFRALGVARASVYRHRKPHSTRPSRSLRFLSMIGLMRPQHDRHNQAIAGSP